VNKNTIKPSLGNPARGEAFYPRKREIEKIFKVLDANASIYLSAPRRVGKTSILQFLEDSQGDNEYFFIYTITESVYSVNEFFKVLYDSTIKSKAIKNLAKASKAITAFVEGVAAHVDEIPGILKLKEQQEPDYYEKFKELLDKIEKGVGRVVIMVDEFPQTLHNIHKKHGEVEARRLIQMTKEIRVYKLAEDNLSFIYTGSISLFPMVEKIGQLTDVNDLQPIEVKPLTRVEAEDLLSRLCNRMNIKLKDDAAKHLLDTIKWFIPFHIQLICHELEDMYEGKEIEKNGVDIAIDNTIAQKNKARFEPYFSRLKSLLESNEYRFAMEVLAYTARHDTIDILYINDCAVKNELDNKKEIMDMLCEDGYLFESDGSFIYTSPILQLWCKKFN